MVRIKEIRQSGNIFSFKYYPLGQEPGGACIYDIKNQKIVSGTPAPEETCLNGYMKRACQVLCRAVSNQKDPQNMVFNESYEGAW